MRALVGIDLRISGHDWLLARAAAYASRLDATVDLVFLQAEGADVSEPMQRLEALLQRLPASVRGRARVESAASPEAGLVQLTAEYDLMIVGNREPRALERFLKGPMASRVLRQAQCPVLVPRGDDPPRAAAKVLVGIDLRGISPGRVLELAGEWAAHLGGTLDALYAVAGRLPHIPDRAVREAAEREWERRHEPYRKELSQLMEDYLPASVRGDAWVARGEPEDVIVAQSGDVDVVLVGNREREGLARLLLGAVAQQVVRRADCDVISLPTALSD